MNWKKLIFKTVAYGLVAIAVIYFIRELNRHLHEIPAINWTGMAIFAVVASILITAVNTATIAINWRLLLKDQDVHVDYLHVWQMVAIAQIGKYMPGNVGHFAGRGVLGKEQGVPLGVTMATTSIETLWNLIVGMGLTLLALAMGVSGFGEIFQDSVFQTEMLVALLVVSVISPTIGILFANRFLPGLSKKLGGGNLLNPPKITTSIAVGGFILFNLIILGWALKLQAEYLFNAPGGTAFQFMLLFSVAWIVGYVVPGSPGGMGVREAMMVALFTPIIGAGPTLGISVTMRVTSIMGDGLAFLLGMLSRKLSPPPFIQHR